jgi:DNA-binding GntR family transcriptional regulator
LTSDHAYGRLRAQILSGELAPGTPLPHQALAARLGTSNGPVIAALRRLAEDGLVEHRSALGSRVVELDEQGLDDLLAVRRALETEAARLAARRASREELERLLALVAKMGDCVRRGRRDEAQQADADFHRAIAQASHNSRLIDLISRCHLLDLVRLRMQTNRERGDFENLQHNHRLLWDAIASSDPERAAAAMHAHLSQPNAPAVSVGPSQAESPASAVSVGPSQAKSPKSGRDRGRSA